MRPHSNIHCELETTVARVWNAATGKETVASFVFPPAGYHVSAGFYQERVMLCDGDEEFHFDFCENYMPDRPIVSTRLETARWLVLLMCIPFGNLADLRQRL